MGLFDALAKEILSKVSGGGGQNPLLDIALNLITSPNTGGLQGLIENFKSKGLEDIISSWVGTGQNQPISKEQIFNVLGKERIQNIAQKMGIPQEEATGGLANLLPEIIDKLTPNGKIEGGLLDQAMKMIKTKAEI